MHAVLEKYIANLPRDSFALWCPGDVCKLTEQDGKHQAEIQLPSACGMRRRFESSWCSSASDARADAAAQAVTALQAKHQIDACFQPILVNGLADACEELQWPFKPTIRANDDRSLTLRKFELDQWNDECELSMLAIEGTPYAFLSSMPTRFNYQLRVGSVVIRLHTRCSAWKPLRATLVKEFHEIMAYQPDFILVAVVSLTGQSIDSEGMTRDVSKGVIPPTAPPWLMAAHRYVERLHQLEALIRFFFADRACT